jgi:hypothetical protein
VIPQNNEEALWVFLNLTRDLMSDIVRTIPLESAKMLRMINEWQKTYAEMYSATEKEIEAAIESDGQLIIENDSVINSDSSGNVIISVAEKTDGSNVIEIGLQFDEVPRVVHSMVKLLPRNTRVALVKDLERTNREENVQSDFPDDVDLLA